MAEARVLVTPGSAALAQPHMLRISQHVISASASARSLVSVETKEKGLQTSRLQALMIGAQERTRTSTPLSAST